MRNSFRKIRNIPRLNGNPPAQKKHFPSASRAKQNFLRHGVRIRGTLLSGLQRQNMDAFRLKAVSWPGDQPRVKPLRPDDHPLIEISDRPMGTNLAVSVILRLMPGIRHVLVVELPTQSVEPQEKMVLVRQSIRKGPGKR